MEKGISRFDFGINTLSELIYYAMNVKSIDSIDCMAYNVNLDFVLSLFKKYPQLKHFKIYSNSEKIVCSNDKLGEINELIINSHLEFCHIKEEKTIIHAKIYRFMKEEVCVFGAIGSPNFTRHSNQNFEIIFYIEDKKLVEELWSSVRESFEKYNIKCITQIPDQIVQDSSTLSNVDEDLLEELWKHQQRILNWMATRNKMIINIPPGCGKTRIGITYFRHFFRKNKDATGIVLVPTKTLISQWIDQLNEFGIHCVEGTPNLDNLHDYFGQPEGRIIVTLYSRFFDNYQQLFSNLEIITPELIIVCDECHNLYSRLSDYNSIINEYAESINANITQIGLSATINSFRQDIMDSYIESMGGYSNITELTFQSIYSKINSENKTPILKKVRYIPLKYTLTQEEMNKYNEFARKIAQQSSLQSIEGDAVATAAIERARWVRSLSGGIKVLKDYIGSHMHIFDDGSTIIFVQTHEIAEDIRSFITSHSEWNVYSSAYIFDSHKTEYFRDIALEQFKKNHGYCLIAEKMLSEGFDIPKISRVILHGSDKSERDWIQKAGRALRYDNKNPESIAEIIDIVFNYPDNSPLSIEQERFNVLSSISEDR